jgi:hypothetical protein
VRHVSKPVVPPTNPKPAPTPTVRTPSGLVGYLIQPAAKQKAPTAAAQASTHSAPAASGGGVRATHTSHLDWLLGVLVVLLILLVGAGLESKPSRSDAIGS